ncbi:hypothetical protein SAMN05216466_102649 [Paraburkholderia phenazinium]|jgi:hypothetical protein|uniref:Uncharacterized protein n=1 Tax=Paraburkholderia phenazinium TaxID=60549 RepID=A0A1G7SUZ1_9BURK|nr:hypothetical protein SAMN05216466_102649 [Paraburkholderia phenazinium]
MIADRTYRAVLFLAARVKNRLRFAALTGHKTRRALAHRVFRLRGASEQTVSDGSWTVAAVPSVCQKRTIGELNVWVTHHDSRSRLTSCCGGAPNRRLYSRLNCEALS